MAKKRNYRSRILVLVITTAASLFLAEKIVDRYLPQKTYSRAYKSANTCFQKSNVTVFTLKSDCVMKFEDYDTREIFQTKINNLGYRGEDFDPKKKPGEKRILMEGDSFILGFGVKDRDLVTTHLENKLKDAGIVNPLKNAKVINAGYAGGFGPDGYFLHLKNAGINLQPDLVVFSVFVFNDFSDMADNEWYGIGEFGEPEKVVSKTTFVDDRGYLLPVAVPFIYRVPYLADSNLAVLSFDGLDKLQKLAKHYSDRIKYKVFKPEFPTGDAKDSNLPGVYISTCIFGPACHRQTLHLYTDLLATIKASQKIANRDFSDNTPHFLVLLIPAEFQVYPDTLKKFKTDDGISADSVTQADPNPQKRIKQMLDKEGIAYIDFLPVMRQNPQRLTFRDDGHWNGPGHEMAAAEIYKWILTNYK